MHLTNWQFDQLGHYHLVDVAFSLIYLTRGLCYKHMMIVSYASSILNKLYTLLTDDARVVIYDCQVFIVQATSLPFTIKASFTLRVPIC